MVFLTKSVKSIVKYSIKTIARKPTARRKFSWERFRLEMKLKLRQNKNPLLVCLAFLLTGIVYYATVEPEGDLRHFFLVASGIREPKTKNDFSGLYQLAWPIFLEVIVFGFVAAALLDRYNPVMMSRVLAESMSAHTVVIGNQHVGQRIVDFLQSEHRPFVVVEEDRAFIDDLLADAEPVVLGSVTELGNLKAAAVERCREVFVLVNDLQKAIIICYHLRALNKTCPIYVQLFEHQDFKDYFTHEPFNAFTFSTSEWAAQSLGQWIDPSTLGGCVVFGSGHCAQRFVHYIATRTGRNVYVVDEKIESKFAELGLNTTVVGQAPQAPMRLRTRSQSIDIRDAISTGTVHLVSITRCGMQRVDNHVPFGGITHVFVCWGVRERFLDTLYIMMRLQKTHPNVSVFVRIFDEELGTIVEGMGGRVFSTSSTAFTMLQDQVPESSNIKRRSSAVPDMTPPPSPGVDKGAESYAAARLREALERHNREDDVRKSSTTDEVAAAVAAAGHFSEEHSEVEDNGHHVGGKAAPVETSGGAQKQKSE
eukprot:Opistho-1_new@68533